MIITSKITMDFQRPGKPPVINAVQNDRYSRNLEIALFDNGGPWQVPEDADVLIRYCKPDATGGEYDLLPDGSSAWAAEENNLTVALAPQVLTVPGSVMLSVVLLSSERQISTFGIVIQVTGSVEAVCGDSINYYNIATSSIIAALGYVPASTTALQRLTVEKVSKTGLSIGIHTDGLLYLYLDGRPTGNGIRISGGVVGDGVSTTMARLGSTRLGATVLA